MSFTNEQVNYILRLYEISNRTPRIAVELFEKKYDIRITACTVRAKWKESRLEVQSQGGFRTRSRRKPQSPLYHLPSNPCVKYLTPHAKIK